MCILFTVLDVAVVLQKLILSFSMETWGVASVYSIRNFYSNGVFCAALNLDRSCVTLLLIECEKKGAFCFLAVGFR